MTIPPIPPLTELAAAHGETKDELISFFLAYYDRPSASFNYLTSTRLVKQAYRGFRDISQLVESCGCEKTKQGLKSNQDIVRLGAPVAFDRTMQVFDLPRRQFAFGRDLRTGFRVPFFFVENGIVKLYFLQPRKGLSLSPDQMAMIAKIHKRFLLDTEFFGQQTDLEYVDLSADGGTGERAVTRYSMRSLELWSEKRLSDRLTMIAEALDYVRNSGLIKPRRRIVRPPAKDLPLFD